MTRRGRTSRTVLLLLGPLALTAFLLARPLEPGRLVSHPSPVRDYAQALLLVDSLCAADGPAISTECGTKLMTHGRRTGRVVVMFHGLTNCPAQFDSLGRMAFARGANVLIPRLPRHGFADRMTPELARLNARELCEFTDRVLDAAHGLGDSVTVAGLSIGGVMAGWAGQHRADVDRAVMIAPIFGVLRAPGRWTPVVARLAAAAPNQFVWWDDKRKQDLLGPRHVYPRFATRSVAATLYVGAATTAAAARQKPACRSVVLVTVGGDDAADNAMATGLMNTWRQRGAAEVIEFEFPGVYELSHDIVDPEQVGGDPVLTYPVLMRLILP